MSVFTTVTHPGTGEPVQIRTGADDCTHYEAGAEVPISDGLYDSDDFVVVVRNRRVIACDPRGEGGANMGGDPGQVEPSVQVQRRGVGDRMIKRGMVGEVFTGPERKAHTPAPTPEVGGLRVEYTEDPRTGVFSTSASWLGTPLHGVSEACVHATGAFVVFWGHAVDRPSTPTRMGAWETQRRQVYEMRRAGITIGTDRPCTREACNGIVREWHGRYAVSTCTECDFVSPETFAPTRSAIDDHRGSLDARSNASGRPGKVLPVDVAAHVDVLVGDVVTWFPIWRRL